MSGDKHNLRIENAIEFCIKKFKKNRAEIIKMLQEGDCRVHSAFRYGIAKEVSLYLKKHIDGVVNVYLYGSTTTYEARMCSDIDMLVHIDTNQKEVEDVVKKLEKDVLSSYFKILCNKISLTLPLLDVHIIDTESIEKREGYAALVTSLSSPPLKI